MFRGTLLEFKTNQAELHRQAANFQLVKLLEKPDPWTARVFTAIGKLLIVAGIGIINRYQTAQYKYYFK
jgi:hypothetical protein